MRCRRAAAQTRKRATLILHAIARSESHQYFIEKSEGGSLQSAATNATATATPALSSSHQQRKPKRTSLSCFADVDELVSTRFGSTCTCWGLVMQKKCNQSSENMGCVRPRPCLCFFEVYTNWLAGWWRYACSYYSLKPNTHPQAVMISQLWI